ncbi:FAD-dependent oxidoreductase [Kribbella amoyensis]|uniref:FAD-dependent oxidoreductase n=1 Tax=Kribbella amoyensis TaxID=996641 RepID=UPI001EE22FBC|nr:FAD-dependent oxidoreductase [Kribbella amoyensis]
MPLYWFQPRDQASTEYRLERFPSFIWELPNGDGLWGHGSGDGFGIKIGIDHHTTEVGQVQVDPDELDRYIHLREDIELLASAVERAFPGIDPRPDKVLPCMVTDSPDGQFLVGRPGGHPRLVVAGGDSGHGFKHCGGLGELLAQLTVGETPYCETGFLDPDRF